MEPSNVDLFVEQWVNGNKAYALSQLDKMTSCEIPIAWQELLLELQPSCETEWIQLLMDVDALRKQQLSRRRGNIRGILTDLNQRREIMTSTIIALQARAGIVTTNQQAESAYDKVVDHSTDQSDD